MTIRNTLLGGTDLATSDFLSAEDLNDTFDAAAGYVKTLTTFWLNSYTRTLYDNFSSYTTDAAVPATKWTTTGAGTAYSFTTRASTNAGGTSKEGELFCVSAVGTGSVAYATSVSLTADKHKFLKVYSSLTVNHNNNTGYANTAISFNGTDYDIINSLVCDNNDGENATSLALATVLIIAKGSNEYDCYIGGKLIRTVTDATFQIILRSASSSSASGGTGANAYLYIADVYESSGSV